MKKVLYTLFIIMCVTIVASCGKGHDAKGHVKKFMTEQMGLDDYDVIAWSNIDSTSHVKDSMLQVMHQTSLKDKLVKKGTTYQPRTEKLNLITVRYKIDNDTLTSTFYLDDKLSGIVGVKGDGIKK